MHRDLLTKKGANCPVADVTNVLRPSGSAARRLCPYAITKGIYLWRVEGTSIHANTISNSADGTHLEFSDDNGMGQNTVTHSRYAIHFMSSDNNRVLSNIFRDNLTGAVLMFSQDLLVKDNQFSNNRDGATGAGMLIKDVDNIFVEGNTLQRNKYGITVEGTPNSAGASATFIRNLLALNTLGTTGATVLLSAALVVWAVAPIAVAARLFVHREV